MDIDNDAGLAAMLAPAPPAEGDEERFDPKRAARIQGWVISVKTTTTPESCNCHAEDAVDQDAHIEIGLSRHAPRKQRVIVEITPRLRKAMKDMGEDWGTGALQTKLQGKWVEFTGWMMFDFVHAGESENTNPGHQGNWRATAWELHPVTGIKVLDDPTDLSELHPAHLGAFQAVHARTAAKDPKIAQAIQKRLKKYTAGLSSQGLKELREEADEHK